jgi:hypothetical protein
MPAANTPAASQLSPGQQNALARQLILANSVDRVQQIYSQTVNAAASNVVNVQPRNVGLLKGFIVDVIANVTATAAATITKLGPANILSQVIFTDLQNNTRIQTTGWHLHLINTARSMKPFAIPFAMDSASPIAYGNNFDVISCPDSLAAAGNGVVTMRYYVPLAYAQDDLRGAVYAAVTNATMNLQLSINTAAFVAAGDATGGVFSGGAGTVGNVTVNVYQHYLDQLPMGQTGPVLPVQDLSTVYELKNTTMTGIAANQDFPVPYANFRSFLSTFMIYDNGGTLNAGSDVNYWALQSANFTNIWKMSPVELAMLSRIANGVDYPDGVYYASHRTRPINTAQYGNIELILNALTVNAGAQLLVGYEDFAIINVLNNAGSLAAG